MKANHEARLEEMKQRIKKRKQRERVEANHRAEHLWLQRAVAKSGGQWQQCCRCHHSIRFAVSFLDTSGNTHIVGEDCAAFIFSGLNLEKYAEKRLLSEMKSVKTKNGPRVTLRMKVPQWFWSINRNERPKFASTSKYEKPGRYSETIWYLTIWGETAGEVIENWTELRKIRDTNKQVAEIAAKLTAK